MLVLQPPALREAVDARYHQDDAESKAPVRRSRAFIRSHTIASAAVPHKVETAAKPSVPLDYEVPECAGLPAYAHRSADNESDLARVHAAMRQARRIAVVCGAGVSVSAPANIPDFRSATGLFRKLKEKHPNAGLSSGKDLFDARLFSSEASTALFYSMMAELKDLSDAAQPTYFHHLLKRLDDEGRLQRVYTQNIDGLEQKAGLTFGLDSTLSDATSPTELRKRKRMDAGRQFARSKSDSVLAQRRGAENRDLPMFPRAVPLHGSLSTLTCALCSYKICLDAGTSESDDAMGHMRRSEPVWCPQCEGTDSARSAAGLRSRGIGRMKVDVVLYNGENSSAELVGSCVERDLLGLRDPNEPMVPETPQERRAREKRELQQLERQKTDTAGASNVLSPAQHREAPLSDIPTNTDAVLAAAFMDDEEPKYAPEKPVRRRLKPLPPDLLIVAGTSLKVPGTKRIVREFAKACRARDAARDDAPVPAGCTAACHGEHPVRTVFLNYDFPSPPKEWDGVFDVWVQGDVQNAALGLCEPRLQSDGLCGLSESLIQANTWARLHKSPAPALRSKRDSKPGSQARGKRAQKAPAAQSQLKVPSGKLSTVKYATKPVHGAAAQPPRAHTPHT